MESNLGMTELEELLTQMGSRDKVRGLEALQLRGFSPLGD